MTKPISWRPTEEAALALAELMQRTGKSRSKLLNDLILTARRGPEIVADNDGSSAAVAQARLHTGGIDHAKLAAFQEKTGMTIFDAKKRGRR